MDKIVKSQIISIGESAIFDDYKILILFGEIAPVGIDEVSIIHRYLDEANEEMLTKGSKLFFGNQEYVIEEIGDIANETLHELGHASLYFGLDEGVDLLPGSILLKPYQLPTLAIGDVIKFVK